MGAGRVNGAHVEIRRFYKGLPTTALLYGEALRTGWLSSQQMIDQVILTLLPRAGNKLRILAKDREFRLG
jgi:hypothetical protein